MQHRNPFVFPFTTPYNTERPMYWNSFLSSLRKYTNENGLLANETLQQFEIYHCPHDYCRMPADTENVLFHGYFQSYLYFKHEYSRIYELLDVEYMKTRVDTIDRGRISVKYSREADGTQGNSKICEGKAVENSDGFASVKYSGRAAEGVRGNSGERSSSEFQGVAESEGRSKSAIFGRDAVSYENRPTVSIHFRLGDYVSNQCYHPVLSWEYYKRAVEHILATVPEATDSLFLVFYEKPDRAHVEKTIARLSVKLPDTVEFRMMEPDEDWKQLLMIGKCDHHILANSTFSWWGACLSRNRIDEYATDKVICYPSVWYGHQLYYICTDTLFPKNWTKIDAESTETTSQCKCFL